MTSIFHGKTSLRYKFDVIVWTELTAGPAIDITTSIMLTHLNAADKISLIHNSMDVDLVISVVHPDADSSVFANRLVLFEIPSCSGMDQEMLGAASMNVDPGTKFFVHVDPCCPLPTKGKLRLYHWG